jgi:proteic killer suppression protein
VNRSFTDQSGGRQPRFHHPWQIRVALLARSLRAPPPNRFDSLFQEVWSCVEEKSLTGSAGGLEAEAEAGMRHRAVAEQITASLTLPRSRELYMYLRVVQMIDDATSDRDLRVPPSNHFEKLRGNLACLHSIRVKDRWRLVFRWDGSRGEAEDLYLDDHSYR